MTVLWRSYDTKGRENVVSIPCLVEDNAESLRARYLEWIYDLGETKIKGKRIVDHLEIRPGLSYWWMTSQAQKANFYDSPEIVTVVKCFAFEQLCTPFNSTSEVRLVTSSAKTRLLLNEYCSNRRVKFTCEQVSPRPVCKVGTAVSALLFSMSKAGLYALRAAARSVWNFSACERNALRYLTSTICGFDILVHLQKRAFCAGDFDSEYWTYLPSLLKKANIPSTWIHNYFAHRDIRSLAQARALVNRFNRASTVDDRHGLIDSQLDVRAVFESISYYLRVAAAFVRLSDISHAFRPVDSNFNFWPLYEKNWRESLVGAVAMCNCITVAVYRRALSRMPRQSVGIYLLENQPWEFALLHAWRSNGHGKIIGTAHTTVRFWDLRYFYDRRSYERTRQNDLPMPDTTALNGPAALHAYLNGGYPPSQLFEVEALRYLHLSDKGSNNRTNAPVSSALQLLVCGDNIPGSNERLLNIVEAAANRMPRGTRYIFKPHKARFYDVSKYKSLNLTISDDSLSRLLNHCDMLIAGNVTSATVDAYCMNIPLATMLPGGSLNASPLRGLKGVCYFTNASELVEIVSRVRLDKPLAPEPYFYLDRTLPRWRALLGL